MTANRLILTGRTLIAPTRADCVSAKFQANPRQRGGAPNQGTTTWLVNPEREPLANSSCSTWYTRTARSDPTAGFRARRSAVSKATNQPKPLSKNRTRRSRQSRACHAARSRASVALARKRRRPNSTDRSAASVDRPRPERFEPVRVPPSVAGSERHAGKIEETADGRGCCLVRQARRAPGLEP